MKRFVLKQILPNDPEFDQVLELENRVFWRAFQNDAGLMLKEYGRYKNASVFLAVYDTRLKQYAGFMRLIRHSTNGFKSLNDLEREPWGGRSIEQVLADTGLKLERETTLDIATLGVDKGYRAKDNQMQGALVSSALYHGLIKYSLQHKYTHWVAVLDDKVLALVQDLGANFHHYKDIKSARYIDSPSSTPVWSHIETALLHARHAKPLHYQILVKGHGINQIVDVPGKFKTQT